MTIDSEFNDLIDHFFQEKLPMHVYSGNSGYNNTTRYLERNGEKYILRIYGTHNEEAKVKLEHEVLIKLDQLGDLPFQIPVPVVRDGHTLLRLSTKKIGCVYHYIEGETPVFQSKTVLFSFGLSVGWLINAFSKIELSEPFVYPPYYEIEKTHPNCPIKKVVQWCTEVPEPFQEFRKELAWISSQLIDFQAYVPQLQELPHQTIHGDLTATNLLISPVQTINGILDFEFTTRDLRVMEVAVCVSSIIARQQNEDEYLEKIAHFFSGLATMISLTDEEVEALPILVQLRRLDIFVHFLGRYLDGLDESAVLKEHIVKTASYQSWLNGGGRKLVGLWKKKK